MRMYSIRDSAAEYFLPPFFAITDNQAKRMFIGSLGPSFPHRADFILYYVGEFNDEDGLVSPSESPQSVLSGMSISQDFAPQMELPFGEDPTIPVPTTNVDINKTRHEGSSQ